ncbi:hypothetical protein [Kibdelosporangium phytohabitans]|uniref:Uncharacterized protein n=1 Tax=Kibdelosporangium phytohabitans TaxID=860235 RepID=A0A0N9I4T7_9PSEU|nr:hypothetical protein [Kibdelosporangium phytohabitans]ALG13784.1 hypothetical protein AOZ06_49160 [Kibdelosporangium phytohabitans]MBE1467295.1 hypothetical protein [Kibdelosporangium phytohabitans]
MERPTSGRRHIRAGSVTVAELIKNRPTPVHAESHDDEAVTEQMPAGIATEPMPPISSADDAEQVQPPAPNTHRRRPARSGQLAKLAGLGVATVVLCGSIAAASIINTRRQASTDAAERPVAEMTDEQALLPNMFTLTAGNTPRITTELPAPNKGSASATVDNPAGSRRPADAKKLSGSASAPPTQTANAAPTDTELVREYYKLLAKHPQQAVSLLDGLLRQTDLSRFVDSWSQTRDIRVIDVQSRGDGALLAVVEMILPDGATARVQQLLRVTDGQPKRITGAEIVSAQRS